MTTEPILISSTDKPFPVYTNPSLSQLSEIGPLVRFFANDRNKVIYVWNYYDGFHSQVSIGLNFSETFNSTDLLRGHAGKNDDGIYEMVGSDFLREPLKIAFSVFGFPKFSQFSIM